MHRQISSVLSEIDRHTTEVTDFVQVLDATDFNTRPPSGKWSVAEHLEHLRLSNEPYAAAITRAVREGGSASHAPPAPDRFRRSLFMRFFIRTLKPPVRFRVKTFPVLVPESIVRDRDQSIAGFHKAQHELRNAIESGDGLDLGRIKITSPFVSWIKMPVIQAGDFLVAHGDRHLWLMKEALAGVQEA